MSGSLASSIRRRSTLVTKLALGQADGAEDTRAIAKVDSGPSESGSFGAGVSALVMKMRSRERVKRSGAIFVCLLLIQFISHSYPRDFLSICMCKLSVFLRKYFV